MRANEKEGWFAMKKLLLTAGIALTVLPPGIFLWFGPYGTQPLSIKKRLAFWRAGV